MISTNRIRQTIRSLVLITSMAMIAGTTSLSHAQLLVERYRGGLHRYTSTGNRQSATFDLAEASRIHGVTGWFPGTNQQVVVSISLPFSSPPDGQGSFPPSLYEASFQLTPVPLPPPGQQIDSGKWQGVAGLEWDLEGGSYNVTFAGSAMPFAHPYFGPVHDVPEPYNFMNFQDEELIERQPFGVRIYGAPLSAVPEAPTFGLTAALIAAAAAILRTRWRRQLN